MTAGLAASPAQASGLTTFLFAGNCTDCQGVGLGTLVLQNWTPGHAATVDNFYSWSYASSLISYNFSLANTSPQAFNFQADFANLQPDQPASVEALLSYSYLAGFQTDAAGHQTPVYAVRVLESSPAVGERPAQWEVFTTTTGPAGGDGPSINDDFGTNWVWERVPTSEELEAGLPQFEPGPGPGPGLGGGGVPEPMTWVLMIGGLGLAGAQLRARRRSFV